MPPRHLTNTIVFDCRRMRNTRRRLGWTRTEVAIAGGVGLREQLLIEYGFVAPTSEYVMRLAAMGFPANTMVCSLGQAIF